MLLDAAPGKKAGALAVSLTLQTMAAGTLLLIPLVYTDRLPFVQLQLPTFLPAVPVPREAPKAAPTQLSQTHALVPRVLTMPVRIPPLNTQPEIGASAPLTDLAIGNSLPQGIALPSLIPLPPPPPPPHVVEALPSNPIPVSSEIQSAKLLRKVVPIYPRMAVVARVSGTVRLLATVGEDGRVRQVDLLSGPALLVRAAIDAVREWVYRPTLLNGKPVEVIAPIDVNFTLSQ